jgi:hypothetical protein
MSAEPVTIDPPVSVPSVTVIGCGGAGINMLRCAVPHISERASYRYLDTSYANIRPEEPIIVIGGEGSGAHRREKAEAIGKKIAGFTSEDLNLADINIVVFSMSGGSGSVLGPVLIREIARRGALVVAIVIASSQSELHTKNTLNTLKTLEQISAAGDLYLPVTVFDNAIGMDIVDRSLPYKIERLVDILTLPTAELDKNDRLHWINVPKTTGAAGGLRLLHVDAGQERDVISKTAELWSIDDDFIFDSTVSIRTAKERPALSPKARVAYDGIFTTVQLTPMIGLIGSPRDAFKRMTTAIEDTLVQYNAQSFKRPTAVAVSTSDVDPESGLVL